MNPIRTGRRLTSPSNEMAKGMVDLGRKLLSRAALHGVEQTLRLRVQQYNAPNGSSAFPAQAVTGAVAKMCDVLGSVSPAFPSEFEALTQDARCVTYLRELNAQLAAGGPLKLWERTLLHTDGNPAEAIRWIAVLLQDTAAPAFLCKAVKNTETRWLLEAVLTQLAKASPAELYPPGIASERAGLYHFYVPAYLAQRLVAEGVDRRLALLVPSVLTSEYELQMLDFGPHCSSALVPLKRLLFDGGLLHGRSEPLDSYDLHEESIDAALEDMYLGYRGALLGSGLTLAPTTMEQFANRIDLDPDGALQALFAATARNERW